MRVPALAAVAAGMILGLSGSVQAECVWPYTDVDCARMSNRSIRIIPPTHDNVPGSLQAYRDPGPFVEAAPDNPRSAFASAIDPMPTNAPPAAISAPNETTVVTVVRGGEATNYIVPRDTQPR